MFLVGGCWLWVVGCVLRVAVYCVVVGHLLRARCVFVVVCLVVNGWLLVIGCVLFVVCCVLFSVWCFGVCCLVFAVCLLLCVGRCFVCCGLSVVRV